LEEEGSITGVSPAKYCYAIARTVCLECWRSPEYGQVNLDDVPEPGVRPNQAAEEREEQERLLDCLGRCMQELNPASDELIIQYYQGETRVKIENRRGLSGKLGISMDALRSRAMRIRARLEGCIRECVKRR
jgi:DNA-directed RNA polymerase specialized sigma24 family protein